MNMMTRIRDTETEPVHCITCKHWMALNAHTGLCWRNTANRSAILSDAVETEREDGCTGHAPFGLR